MISTYLENTRF